MRRTARTAVLTAAASAALFTAACGSEAERVEPTTAPSSPADSADGAESGSFTPGDYEATGSYQTPGGTQSVDVDLTLEADGTITDLDVEGNAEGGNSEQFQGKFESGIDAEVVGKKITELDVSKVSGSSLTSGGFNDAIAQITDDARA
ncbi:FMN-binding protein [Aeromicrobium sp. YIM 150415]|uniref:FMN-binding protein n=1 Tax=Aeromicrobium sp. YIM 150415 TaxID=2803912 RepID=UPI0019632FB1|nr:FMN-binding protein [Aeromicrobium sp. YIM 150415]MBM9465255.1 FMN-binding protein [Aeromicrobium sp. YIM 150415]